MDKKTPLHFRYQSDVIIRTGSHPKLASEGCETFIWQLRGSGKVRVTSGNPGEYPMAQDDTLLLQEGAEYEYEGEGKAMFVSMDPGTKGRVTVKK